jgi:phenylacetate-CoA ligase
MDSTYIRLASEAALAQQPLRLFKGLLSKFIAYPYGEAREQRLIRPKTRSLRKYYLQHHAERIAASKAKLVEILAFSKYHVPYYRDLFRSIGFEPEKVYSDLRYLNDIPLLTKTIIREQGDRLLSTPLDQCRHYICKTGGSTGQSCVIYYDQEAADYSAAITLFTREKIGKTLLDPELHFASRFPGHRDPDWRDKEFWKCLALNRSNIFFNRLDDESLEEIWRVLNRRKPRLIHEHSSTIYALACYVEKTYGSGAAFDIFESSGETLQPYMRKKIADVLNCRVVNRYGLAEAGVIAYQFDENSDNMRFLESECWPEEHALNERRELVITPLRNKLMPLIRYMTGDEASIIQDDDGIAIQGVIGRMHDVIAINGSQVPTHHIMDVLDHRVGSIQEFQINVSTHPNTLRLVLEAGSDAEHVKQKVEAVWPKGFIVEFINHSELVRVGRHNKFRHVVSQ